MRRRRASECAKWRLSLTVRIGTRHTVYERCQTSHLSGLRLYATELRPKEAHKAGDYASASERLVDSGAVNNDDKGWYLQEMARYHYRLNRTGVLAPSSSGSQKQPLVAEATVRGHCREIDRSRPGTRRAHR